MTETLTRLQEDTLNVVMERRRHNPIVGKEIASAIGLKERKSGKEGADLRSIIHALRCKGYPVCAAGRGYYWPANREEAMNYAAAFEARMIEMSKAVAGMKFGVDRIDVTEIKAVTAKPLYYMVEVEGERKSIRVHPARLAEFLAKYPSAMKV